MRPLHLRRCHQRAVPAERGKFFDKNLLQLHTTIATPIAQTFFGQHHWTRRTWLDLGDISYRQGPGYFHVAAEAYRGALQRAVDVFRPDQQVRIVSKMLHIVNTQKAGPIANTQQLRLG